LRIAFDASCSLDRPLTGVGVYCRELLRGLASAHPEARLLFGYRPHRYLRSFGEALPAGARRRLLQAPLTPGLGRGLFHGLNQRLPRFPLARSVATFHDLFVLTGEYSTPEFRRRFAAQAEDAAARADLIIAVSAFTAGQIEEHLKVARSRIRVVHHGVRRRDLPGAAREELVLNVGSMQRRKNVARLVAAFERLPEGWSLVLAGGSGYGATDILDRIASSPARERIRIAGYVSPAELDRLYARASIFAFPSLDEGFGMPVLEAMAAGVPVITSSRSALPEVAADAALTVDPENQEQITEALAHLAASETLRSELRARGLARSKEFSWAKTVRETWNVYRELG